MTPYYQDDWATIYNADCRDVSLLLPPVDLLLTDPPYGMEWDGRVTRGPNGTGKRGETKHYGTSIVGDNEPFDPAPWITYPRVILWGFQHYSSRLPEGSLLVWIKRYDTGFGSFLSDADTAWMKGGCGVYCRRDVSLQGQSGQRFHPAQKPVGIMKWCIAASKSSGIILDPYMGSGSTLVSAKSMNRRAIGIEIEERYCEIAARRLAQEVLALA